MALKIMREGYAAVGEQEARLLQHINALDPLEYVALQERSCLCFIIVLSLDFTQERSSVGSDIVTHW